VVLALGHPALRWPDAVEAVRDHPRIAHGYESPSFSPGERVVIVGGGIAATHLWLAALKAGAHVIALHREPLRHQALNAPRCFFSAAAIDAYRRLSEEERRAWLRHDRGSSYPWRMRWEWRLARAKRSGRFRTQRAALAYIIAESDPARPLTLSSAGAPHGGRVSGKGRRWIAATQ
jgi:glycine/D-amino acid oxidase-like deaminating enzyme